jgi:hypothetical protein
MSETQEQAILTGGASVALRKNDGSSESVNVRLLKIREFPDYLRLVDDEEKLAEFLCDKPNGWAESLEVDSLLDICDKGHELNFTNACRWGQRRAKLNEALLPIATSGQAIQSAFPNSVPTARASSEEA